MAELKFDPITRDWIRDGKGGFVRTAGSDTTVMHNILTHFGEDPLDPDSGSLFHDASRFLGDTKALLEDEARRCNAALVARGVITSVTATARVDERGGAEVDISYRDVRTGAFNRFSFRVPVGSV